MLKKRDEKPRLNKKVTTKEKFDQWLYYYLPYLMFLMFIFVAIIFIILIFAFIPGNDSAIVYNWGI